MIHYLPLERLETRYTAHLDDAIVAHLDEGDEIRALRYYPNCEGRETLPPAPGHFLNAPSTIEFKAKQIAQLAEQWSRGRVRDGDMIFASDLWFPGLEAVGYLRFFTGIDVKLRGILWAGSWTDHDIIGGCESWASLFENALFQQVDRAFVGSDHFAADIASRRLLPLDRIEVTGAPLDLNAARYKGQVEREPIVLFNGRASAEKQPHLLDALDAHLTEWVGYGNFECVNAIEQKLSKDDYYKLLARSTVVVSFALEETFGFGVQEAVLAGCIPVVPDTLCYPEQFSDLYRYSTWGECCELVARALEGDLAVPPVRDYSGAVERWFA